MTIDAETNKPPPNSVQRRLDYESGIRDATEVGASSARWTRTPGPGRWYVEYPDRSFTRLTLRKADRAIVHAMGGAWFYGPIPDPPEEVRT